MNRRSLGGYIAAIDIGTTKIVVLIATVSSHGKLDIVGIGQHPSNGLRCFGSSTRSCWFYH